MAVCGGPTRRGRRVKRRIGLAREPRPWQTARLGEDLDLRPPIRPRRLTTRGPGGSHGRTDVAPSHRLAVPVGHHPGGWSRSHRRPMACSRLPPPSSSISWALKRWERHQQWLARRVRVDDIGQVLEPVRRQGVRLPRHGVTSSRPRDTGADRRQGSATEGPYKRGNIGGPQPH